MPRQLNQELSPREDEILRLAAEGFTDQAIGQKLGISDGTVGTYWGRIRTKMGPYPRTELIAIRVRSQFQQKLDRVSEDRDVLQALLHSAMDTELMYEDVVDQAGEGVIVVNGQGVIEHANPAAHQMFRYPLGSLHSIPLSQLVPKRIRKHHADKFAEFCRNHGQGPATFRVETKAIDKLGAEFDVAITVAAVHRGDELLLTGLFERLASRTGGGFRISVNDLRALGLKHAEKLDTDGDGWVDEREFEAAIGSMK